MTVKNYQELVAWQKSMDLVEDVYKLTKHFPRRALCSHEPNPESRGVCSI